MTYQSGGSNTFIDPRRFAAVDIYGRRGGKARRRLILAEFVLAAIGMPTLGLVIVLAASSVLWVLLGVYLIGMGLNYLPLALNAISLTPAGNLEAEVAGLDVGAQLRRYTRTQAFLLVPLFILICGAQHFVAGRRAPSDPGQRRA
jgi:hypothetical protein